MENLKLRCENKKNCTSNHKHDEAGKVIIELVKRRDIWI